jgi:hypothetical protein
MMKDTIVAYSHFMAQDSVFDSPEAGWEHDVGSITVAPGATGTIVWNLGGPEILRGYVRIRASVVLSTPDISATAAPYECSVSTYLGGPIGGAWGHVIASHFHAGTGVIAARRTHLWIEDVFWYNGDLSSFDPGIWIVAPVGGVAVAASLERIEYNFLRVSK